MNCKQVEELLPLYVGHDLEDERVRLITAHVQTCTQCARSAEEYIEANKLLQGFPVPQFSEATFAAVRHNVLREIERESRTPTLRDLLLRPFQPRVVWAVSTAVLLAVCALAYLFVANRTNKSQDQRANATINRAENAGGQTASATGSPEPNLVVRHDPVTPGPAGQLHSPATAMNLDKPRTNQTSRHNGMAANSSTMNSRKQRLNQTVSNSTNAGEPPAVPGAVPVNASITSGKPLRLEIQTRDPNIRIIWFSQTANEGSPNESSKGI